MFEFMQNANMGKSVELARLIQNSVCSSAGRIDKGVHQAGFLVLRESYMPSCLIELGFITSPDEEEFLNSPEGIDAMAKGIYNAFVKYKNIYDTHIVVPYRADKKNIAVSRVIPSVPVDSPRPVPTQTVPRSKKKSSTKKVIKTGTNSQTPLDVPDNIPLFKVQIFAVNQQLRAGCAQFRGHTDIDCIQDGSLYKYTIGASTDYNEIARLREKLRKDFPQAFVIALKGGKRIDTNQAISEFLKNKK